MSSTGPVLLAYDGSDGAKAAIADAGRLLAGKPAVVVSVWESIESAASASVIGLPSGIAGKAYEEVDRETAERTQQLAEEGAELAREAGFDASARAQRCTGGNVWSTVVALAEEEDAAAVVIGSRGRSAIKSALMGSVSHGVVGHCRQPVVVVRQPD